MIITLTTDFGLSDPFAGIMKGVILGVAPDVQIVDITHDIHSYDIMEAAFLLNSAFRYFPEGTIHVAVVDPGVGSARRAIAAAAHGHYFVAPDNGILSLVLQTEPPAPIPPVFRISNESLFHAPVSRTFHGRDIFASIAAHFARGTPLELAGERILDFVHKPLPHAPVAIRIDKYGNIVTNIRAADIRGDFVIRIAGLEITRICESFSAAEPGEYFAIEGSTGYIEIALNQGSAAERLKVRAGAEIEVETEAPNQ